MSVTSRLAGAVESFREKSDLAVFGLSVATLLAIIVAIVAFSDTAASALGTANQFIITNLGWLYLWVVFLSFVFVAYIMIGPWGRIKLGGPDAEPEFTFWQYLVMTFTAGLSSGGLEFWGPVEPLIHYGTRPPYFDSSPGTWGRMADALQYAIYHYGLSAWATYLVFAVAISYFVYRKDAPFRPAVILAPFLGTDNLDGPLGKLVDALAVVITVSGITVSFGLGISQFASGLSFKWGIGLGQIGRIGLILVVGALFLLSVIAGIQKGIKRFADLNVFLLIGLMAAIFAFGQATTLVNLTTQAMTGYVTDFVGMSLFFAPDGDTTTWLSSWTLFFWPWWLTFAPMIGIFMARISKGRTLRELVFAGLFGSFALTVPWYAATGGSALLLQTSGAADLLGVYESSGLEAVGFGLFEELLPYPGVFSAALLVLVVSFLITTLDSSTLSIAMMAAGGDESPSTINRLVWGLMMVLLTIALSLAGGMSVLQSFTILVGLPTAILCAIAMLGMLIELEREFPVLTESDNEASERSTTAAAAQPSVEQQQQSAGSDD
ncbi:BCCT family transporter [Halolamina sp. CBA1230]|uniref:BCCT family transporter n=1 Tax=Halolamina sp. CBA1230 TaxID=1853690 RepID=UPI0009A234C0|nr:BCCT family transporter [Halolamina sp. CBA1230]QKY19350.1 BCCT family transporter [Halolamina sp. CBA1230]